MLPTFTYLKAASLDEAIRSAAEADCHVMAGGTDLLGCLRDGVFAAKRVVSLGGLPELREVREDDGGLRIGALVPVAGVAGHRQVRTRYPVLAQAAAAVASPQLRNQGTLGGNLCQRPRCWYYRGGFPCLRRGGSHCSAQDGQNQFHCVLGGDVCVYVHPSDTAPALAALEAEVVLRGPGGRRSVPLGDFYVLPGTDPTRETVLEPGEVLTEIVVPAAGAGVRSRYRKVRSRGAWDFAVVSTALAVDFDGDRVRAARVVLGGVAPVPWRSTAAENELQGRALTAETARRSAAAAVDGAAALDYNAAKIAIARGVLETELLALG